ncbi:winged helix-turn-helix domain-containing protein [Thiobacillus sp.]
MAIPDFQSLMMPLLSACADGQAHNNQALRDILARQFGLTEAELATKLPSGRQGVFDNRVAWAKGHLKQAGLIEIAQRGVYRITARGLEVLGENPKTLNIRYLKRFPEYVAFLSGGQNDKPRLVESVSPHSETPDELIAGGYKQLREALAAELLERIKTVSPTRFEELVVELLLKWGMAAHRKTRGTWLEKAEMAASMASSMKTGLVWM